MSKFYFRRGFIVERQDDGEDTLIADFYGGQVRSDIPEEPNQEQQRIIDLLNKGYKNG